MESLAEAPGGTTARCGSRSRKASLFRLTPVGITRPSRPYSTAATWDGWCTARLHQSAWQVGMVPLQIHIIEQLVRKVLTASQNPFKRRNLLDILVEDHMYYALPPSILQDADVIIKMILERENA